MRHALVRRDVAMHDDPLRAQSLSLAVGGVLATLAVAAGAVIALVRPQELPDSAPILIARESGALFVRVGDTLHPVLNLASARLISRSAASPVSVSEAPLARAKKGPVMGIPGAPATIGPPLPGQAWTVCDGDRTVVAVGDGPLEHVDEARPVLVTARGESAAVTYLLYDGQRAAVDLRNLAIVRALRLDDVAPMSVSRALLDTVPEVPAIVPPSIPGAGGPGPATLGGATIGSVVVVQRAEGAEHYVVLRDGVQLVGDVAADLIRFTYDDHARPVSSVAPAAIAALPMSRALAVTTYPDRAGRPVGAADRRTVCARWQPRGRADSSSKTVVVSGDSSLDAQASIRDLAQADGEGPGVDAVLIPGGASAYVRSAGIVGDDGSTGPRFLITDGGVVHGVHDEAAATALGLVQPPEAAPWSILAHLPRGAELSTEAALVVRDGLAAPS
jgi:type VII secretion protein EccB